MGDGKYEIDYELEIMEAITYIFEHVPSMTLRIKEIELTVKEVLQNKYTYG